MDHNVAVQEVIECLDVTWVTGGEPAGGETYLFRVAADARLATVVVATLLKMALKMALMMALKTRRSLHGWAPSTSVPWPRTPC